MNTAERTAAAYNATRQIVRTITIDSGDANEPYTLDHDGAAFVLTGHGCRGSYEHTRCRNNADLAAMRARFVDRCSDGEALGYVIAVTAAADRAMRAAR